MPKGKEVAVAKKGLPDSVQLQGMLDEETRRQRVLDKFIQENLKVDTDYGVIPGTSKPTLYKAGAEKVIGLFNIRGVPKRHGHFGNARASRRSRIQMRIN